MKIFFYGELILFSVDKINGVASVAIDVESNWPISNFLIYYRMVKTFRFTFRFNGNEKNFRESTPRSKVIRHPNARLIVRASFSAQVSFFLKGSTRFYTFRRQEKKKKGKKGNKKKRTTKGIIYYAIRWSSVKIEYKIEGASGVTSPRINADCYVVIEIPRGE